MRKFIVFLGILTLSFFHQSYAKNEQKIVLKENKQVLFDFIRHPYIWKAYNNGILKISLSDNSDLLLLKEGRKLIFWIPFGKNVTNWELLVEFKNIQTSIPIEIDILRSEIDFNIRNDMFQLSLQKKALSCESSAASDIIASYLWTTVHEDTVIQHLPKWDYYNTLPIKQWDRILWGDPNSEFVGYIHHTPGITASQKLFTWYWVYEKPISQAYNTLWFDTQVINISNHTWSITSDDHLKYILEQLTLWSMVQLWWDWCTLSQYDDGVITKKWDIDRENMDEFISAKNTCHNTLDDRILNWEYYDKNWELQTHQWLDGEHAFILLGWKWPIDNPTHIRVWDTDTWYHEYPKHEWMRKWKKMDYRSIIVSKK